MIKQKDNESKFLREFHKALVERGWMSFPQNSFVAPGSRYLPGTPDIIACNPAGQFYGFELKMPGGKLQKSQQRMAELFQRSGLPDRYLIVVYDTGWPALIEALTAA